MKYCLIPCLLLMSCASKKNDGLHKPFPHSEGWLAWTETRGQVSHAKMPKSCDDWPLAPEGEFSQIRVQFKEFNASEHVHNELGLDGMEIHGMDGQLPIVRLAKYFEVENISITWKNQTITLPPDAYKNAFFLFEKEFPRYDEDSNCSIDERQLLVMDANQIANQIASQKMVSLSPNEKMLMIEHDVHNAAGSYGINWLIASDGYLGRFFRNIGS